MTVETAFDTPFGSYQLRRYPHNKKTVLRAWDAADEYLLQHLAENNLPDEDVTLAIVNDAFGGLSIPLHPFQPLVISDSYLSMQAIKSNSVANKIDEDSVTIIDSLLTPENTTNVTSDLGEHIVLIKVPKSLAMLEDQLHRIRPMLKPKTIIVAAAMSKHIHTSTLDCFEKIIGPTKTSLAKKKARLVFCQLDNTLPINNNPYPKTFTLPYQLDGIGIEMKSHAAVFSQDRLDQGSRFLIENLPEVDYNDKTIVDLGCGNGVVGLLTAIKYPSAKLIFTDESYMAVESAISNFLSVFKDTRDAEFLQTDCLQGINEGSVSLILCNPPFHQNNAISDATAWQMYLQSRDVLAEGGELRVIGNRHLAYHVKLKKLFGNCEVVANNKKFVVLKAVKQSG